MKHKKNKTHIFVLFVIFCELVFIHFLNIVSSKQIGEIHIPRVCFNVEFIDKNNILISKGYDRNGNNVNVEETFNLPSKTIIRNKSKTSKEKTLQKIKRRDYEDFGYKDGIYFGRRKNGKPTKEVFASNRNLKFELYDYVINPDIYYMLPNYSVPYSEYIIIAKNNEENPIQGCAVENSPIGGCWAFGLPKQVKNTKLDSVVKINTFVLLFIFKKNNTRHFVIYSYPDYNYRMTYLGHKKTFFENQKYLALKEEEEIYDDERATPNKIQLIEMGGINTKENICGKEISKDIKISSKINLITIKVQ